MQVRQDEDADVGVIIGRFQVPELHEGHLGVIRHVCEAHDKVLIFLGLSPLLGTRENPLDFEARATMIRDQFPDLSHIGYVSDQPTDEGWSERLDNEISKLVTPSQTVVLYGGRDSFQSRYTGRHPTRELVAESYISGSQIRREVSRKAVRRHPHFREGVIWGAFNRFPTAYQTIDVAIFNDDFSRILLGRKENETLYRLIGGFSDPESPSLEADCRREVQQEAGITITDPVYITSGLVDDWRYRGEVDKIKTALFWAKLLHGTPRPGDDIVEVKWFETAPVETIEAVMPLHRELMKSATHAIEQIV